MELKVGETLNIKGHKYRLESKLAVGVGSYGEVWAATDLENQQPVALKFIHAENQAQAGDTAGRQWQMHLQREIDFLGKLTDEAQTEHIVKLLNYGDVANQPVLVLERLHTNLNHWVHQQAKPLPLGQVLEWARQIVAGLAIIHENGFVYRDLKFSNVLVSADGQRLKLADFGTVKAQHDGLSHFSYAGTPSMMAPEQHLPTRLEAGRPVYKVDHRTDFYALGLMLFRLLTDQPTIASQESIEGALKQSGYEGVLSQESRVWGGLNTQEKNLLRDAIWKGWGLDEATAGPTQRHRFQQAQTLYDLIVQLLAPRKEDRPDSAATIQQVLNAALAAAPVIMSLPVPPPVAASSQAPPSNPQLSVAASTPARSSSPSVTPNLSDRPDPPRPRWIYAVVGLVALSAVAGGAAWWWDRSLPPTDTAASLVPQQEEAAQAAPLTPIPTPEPNSPPVGTQADTATSPPASGIPAVEAPATAVPVPPATPDTAPTLTPVPPPVTVTPPPIAVLAPTPRPVDTAPSSVVSSATEPDVAAPATPPPVPPSVVAPEPVTSAETPTPQKPTAKPTPSQSTPQRQPPVESITPPATAWRQLARDRLAGGGSAPEMVVVPAGGLSFTDATGQAQQARLPEFALAAQPVTRAEYAQFAFATRRSLPYASESSGGWDTAEPVTAITWYEAQAYVEWLSEQAGQRYRLPSELEWVYSQKRSTKGELNSAWTGFEWTDGCDFGDCGRDQRMVWSRTGQREARPVAQSRPDISFRVVRDFSKPR